MGGVVNKEKAMKQWKDLKSAIENEGVKVSLLVISKKSQFRC